MSDQPAEFNNPVPDARWDRARSQRFRLVAALLGAISLLAIVRIAWTVLEVAHGVNTVTEIAGLTRGKASKPTTVGRAAPDGASNLPGGYASVAYTPLPGQFEYWEHKDEYGSFGGSSWGLATAESGRMNYAELGHFLLAPLEDPIADENQKLRADNPEATITGPRRVTVDGRTGATWKATELNGDVRYTTWFFGDVHSFRLECRYIVGSADFAKQCKEALRSLRFDR